MGKRLRMPTRVGQQVAPFTDKAQDPRELGKQAPSIVEEKQRGNEAGKRINRHTLGDVMCLKLWLRWARRADVTPPSPDKVQLRARYGDAV